MSDEWVHVFGGWLRASAAEEIIPGDDDEMRTGEEFLKRYFRPELIYKVL